MENVKPKWHDSIKAHTYASRKFLGFGLIFKTQNPEVYRPYYMFEAVCFFVGGYLIIYKKLQ